MADEVTLSRLLDAHKELVQTLKEWKDENAKVATDYATAVQTIQSTINRLDATEKKFFNVYKKPILWACGFILVVGAVFVLLKWGDFCGKFEFPWGWGTYTGRECAPLPIVVVAEEEQNETSSSTPKSL